MGWLLLVGRSLGLSIRIPWSASSRCACPPDWSSDSGIIFSGSLGSCGASVLFDTIFQGVHALQMRDLEFDNVSLSICSSKPKVNCFFLFFVI